MSDTASQFYQALDLFNECSQNNLSVLDTLTTYRRKNFVVKWKTLETVIYKYLQIVLEKTDPLVF